MLFAAGSEFRRFLSIVHPAVVLRFLAEALDVFRAFLNWQNGTALHQFANLLDNIGICKRGNVAGVHAI